MFAVHGLRSALNNTTALARLLIERGHDVTFVSFRDVSADAAHIGAEFVLLSDGPSAAEQLRAHRDRYGDVRSVLLSRRLRSKVLTLREPCQILERLAPDVVIIDSELHGCVLAAHSLGLSTLLTLSWHDPLRSPKRPPMHREIVPAASRLGALTIRLAWFDLVARRRLRQLIGPLAPRSALARILPQQLNTSDYGSIRKMAANLGIDLTTIASRHEWVNPHLYVHRPIVSFTLAELEFDRTPPHGVIHVGPVIDPNRRDRPMAAGRATELQTFIQRTIDENRKLAYCSMGSLQAANVDFYQILVDAFASDPAWSLVIGLGGQGNNVHLDTDDHRTLVLRDAPQLQLLEECDVAVHTGGASTFYECLRAGVPSIIVHTGRTDMPGIAARVRHFGLGVVLDQSNVTQQRLIEAANRLGGGAVKPQLERLRDQIAAIERDAPAVAVIEEMASGPEAREAKATARRSQSANNQS